MSHCRARDRTPAAVTLAGRCRSGLDYAAMELGIRGRTAMVAAGRFGRPEELADAVTFLLSERAGYLSGTSIQIDGGLIGATF